MPSLFRAQVLVVHQGPKKRLVIDYSTTINRSTLLDAYPLPNIEDLVNTVAQARYYSWLDYDPLTIRFPYKKRKGFTRLLKGEVNFTNINDSHSALRMVSPRFNVLLIVSSKGISFRKCMRTLTTWPSLVKR